MTPSRKFRAGRLVVTLLAAVLLASGLVVFAQTLPNAAELSNALLAAKSPVEQNALIESNQGLLSKELLVELRKQGDVVFRRNEFDKAEAAFALLQRIADRLGFTLEKVEALNQLGVVADNRGDTKKAIELYQQALALTETHKLLEQQATVRGNLCNTQMSSGDYDQATAQCQTALALAESLGNKVRIASINNALGSIAFYRGENEKAESYFRKSLEMFQAVGHQRGKAAMLTNLSNTSRARGDYSTTLRYLSESLALQEVVGDKVNQSLTLSNLSNLHRLLGNHPLALQAAERSRAISQEIGAKAQLSDALRNLSLSYAQAGDLPKALDYALQGLALAEATSNKNSSVFSLINVGNTQRKLGNAAAATEFFQRALALAESMKATSAIINSLNNLSLLAFEQGRMVEALSYAERSIARARSANTPVNLWWTLTAAGKAQRALGQLEPARQKFDEAIQIVEAEREALTLSDKEREQYLNSRTEAYQLMAATLATQGKLDDALHFAERAKARVLLDTLRAGKTDITKALSREEIQQEKKLKNELVLANNRLTRATRSAQTEPAQLAALKTAQETARLAHATFETNLYVAHPELKAQRGEAQPLKLTEAAALLPDKNTVLLEFVVTDDTTLLFTLTNAPSGVALKVFSLPIKRAELATLTDAFRRQLADLDLKFRPAAKQLYDVLLKPAQIELAHKTRFIIVPDDKLWELPFQALVTPQNQYLIETAAVSYAPSLAVLREMQRQRKSRPANAGLLAFGNPAFGAETVKRAELAYRDEKLTPLPEAEAEVKALGQLYGAGSKVYTNAAAREDRWKTEAANAGILHIATHGILNDAAPLYSHLALAANDEKEDGLLEAWELMQMDLKADLAVLSACETARGRIGAGEGVIGLSWALFVAGVPSTVVSQWKVESSSTRDLMLGFHRSLKGTNGKPGATKAEALRQAVLPLLKKPATNHPFYWAGFVLVGDGR